MVSQTQTLTPHMLGRPAQRKSVTNLFNYLARYCFAIIVKQILFLLAVFCLDLCQLPVFESIENNVNFRRLTKSKKVLQAARHDTATEKKWRKKMMRNR